MKRVNLALAAAAFVVVALTLPPSPAAAQAPPFFGGGGIFDPEIDVIESGVVLDVQATVSADRKYVTLTPRVQSTQLLAIREFAFQAGAGGAGGQVGGPPQPGGAAADRGAGGVGRGGAGTDARTNAGVRHNVSRKPYPAPGQATISAGPPVLERPGMTLVGKVTPRLRDKPRT